jgi:uncharacterized protein YcfJ
MNHRNTRPFRAPVALWATALAVITLAGCAAPYPVYEQPVSQNPVYNTPSQPQQRPDYRRRDRERLYEADVTSVRAVMGQQREQRCWIEREAVAPQRQQPNVGGAIIGGVIGGVLGHQVGGGRGKDIATAGGAVAGAIIGSNVANDRYGNPVATRDVQRCDNNNVNSEPAYWDVSYQFRGVTHHVQMSSPPGRTVTVNGDGEPRE